MKAHHGSLHKILKVFFSIFKSFNLLLENPREKFTSLASE
jgi:hypothetical protein